jgi:tetratricopeptide (TPR) repeat protein
MLFRGAMRNTSKTGAEEPTGADYRLGCEALRAGRFDAAIASLERAIEARHDHLDAIVALGEAYRAHGRGEDAHDQFQLALAFDPGSTGAHLGLGRLLRGEARYEEAERYLRAALEHAPALAEAWVELGLTLMRLARVEDAASAYGRAIELDPACAEACINLGLIHLTHEGDATAAEAWFRRARDVAPGLPAAHVNLGLALQEQGRMAEALEVYQAALATWPDSADLRWHRATARLLLGDHAAGWPDYEARKLIGGGAAHRHFPYPEWQGEPLGGRRLLVYAEQGVGDEIMFASCIPDLARRGARCVLECAPRLAALFARSFPAAVVHGAPRDSNRDWLAGFPGIELQSAIGSLPRYLRAGAGDFPTAGGYLEADPKRAAHWRVRLEALGAGLKVGLAWRGGTEKTRGRLRSLTLEQCGPLLGMDGTRFVSLQHGGTGTDRESQPALAGWPEALADIDETAALVAALDCVVTVDSSVAHLAGALGRPVAILLPAAAEWRWGPHGETTPWYPTARLVRQSNAGNWDEVIARAGDWLRRGPAAR